MIIESSFMPGAQSESPAAAPPEGDGTNSIPGFERFNPDMRFSDFGGDMDRFSWTQIVAQERPADINVHKLRAREQELAGGTSVFAAQLAANLERRGEEKVMVSNLNLHVWLEVLSEDQDEAGSSDVYIMISRGVEVRPVGTSHPKQVTRNSPLVDSHPDIMDQEIERLLDHGYIREYLEASRRAGYPNEPEVCTLSLNVVSRKGKDRVTCNGSAPYDGFSLNDVIEHDQCRLASVELAATALSYHGWVAVVDAFDAFCAIPISAFSLRFMTIRYRGVLYAWQRANFGLACLPVLYQALAISLCRAVRRRCVLAGLHCGKVAGFDQRQPFNVPVSDSRQLKARTARAVFNSKFATELRQLTSAKPPLPPDLLRVRDARLRLDSQARAAARRTDSITSLQAYLDDWLQASTTRRASWFGFLQKLTLCQDLGLIVNVKPGKCQPPAQKFIYLGVSGSLRNDFKLFLSHDKVQELLSELRAIANDNAVTVQQLAHVVGVLVWAAAVVEARPYYRCLLDIIRIHGYDKFGRWRKSNMHTQVKLSKAQRRDILAWILILQVHNGTDICRGIRRLVCKHTLFSDASGEAIAWCWAGLWQSRPIPASWKPYIFHDSKYAQIFIGTLEGYGMLWGLRTALPKLSGMAMTLRVRVDNRGLEFQTRKMSARDVNVQPILREVMWLCAVYGVRLDISYVPSKLNCFSDYLTREHCAGARGRSSKLAALKVQAITTATAAAAAGEHRDRPPARPDLLPMLQAERVSALRFDSPPVPQSRASMDELLRDWEAPGPRE
jgi:hypothetical protein